MLNNIPKIGERVEIASQFVPKARRLLDVGCADGVLAHFIKGRVEDIYGIDSSIEALKQAQKHGVITKEINLDKDDFQFANNFFDVAVCLDVIEHVINPILLLSSLHKILKKNGTLIISTPNLRFSDHLLKLVINGKFPKTSDDVSLYDGGHIHFFTFQDMRDLLKESGFKITMEKGIINKPKREWKGRFIGKIIGERLMKEFRSPGILIIAKKN